MKLYFIVFLFLLNISPFCFAQDKPAEREMTEKEFAEQIQKYFEERDKLLSKPQIIYYSPVLNPSGTHIAYVKRTLEYRLKGGGLIPFLSSPPEVTRISDGIELCEQEIKTGTEKVIKSWELPEPDNNAEISYIAVKLEFSRQIYYSVNFSSYRKIFITGGIYCYGSGFCVSNRDGDIVGAVSVNGIKVRLDHDPERERYPSNNKIILECENKDIPCKTF